MAESRLLVASWVIYALLLIVGIVIAVMNIINPHDFVVKDQFESYTGQSWTTLTTENPKQAALYEQFIRASACAWLAWLAGALFITLAAYQQTTTISANLIECATIGEADQRLIAALDCLMTQEPCTVEIIGDLLNWGHTSGVDTLLGMLTALSLYSTR